MLQSNVRLRSSVGRSRQAAGVRPFRGPRPCRPVRQPRLGVCAFKDWFASLVQQQQKAEPPKEPQPQAQSTSATAVQEPLQPSVSALPQQPQAPLPPAPKSAPKRDFLEARQVSLFQLFDSSDYKFDIPTYQRPYAWRTKQVYELLQDFVRAYESRNEYFLGAIVATRAADGANVPYQLIDGQQRLTSLVLLLAFLHGWARQQGNEVLEGRFRRMLYLEADPLDPGSNGRYRLRLRDADDAFFRENVLDSFLPYSYRLAGLAAAAADETKGAAGGTSGSSVAASGDEGAAAAGRPLENETWWRLYENATFMRGRLDKLALQGLSLQDFAFHVLRNCFVVLMVARDEGASFRIFSTLNGRGMDLSVVDKLKADLLAGELTPDERNHFAGAWAEMESVLGRAAFHRVFDYMRELAAVRDPWVGDISVLEYFTRRVDDPAAVKQVLQVALDYARLLLQLRQATWAPPQLAALLAETPAEAPQGEQQQQRQPETEKEAQVVTGRDTSARDAAVSAVVQAVQLEQVELAAAVAVAAPLLALEEEGRLLESLHEQHRQWQDGTTAEAPAEVAEPVAAANPPPTAPAEVHLKATTAVTAVVAAPMLGDAEAAASLKVAAAEDDEVEDGGALVFRFDDATPAPSAAAVAASSAHLAAVVADGTTVAAFVAADGDGNGDGGLQQFLLPDPLTAEAEAGHGVFSVSSTEARGPELDQQTAADSQADALAALAISTTAAAVVAEAADQPQLLQPADDQLEAGAEVRQQSPGHLGAAVEQLDASVNSAAASAAAVLQEIRQQLMRDQQQEEEEDGPAAAAAAVVVSEGQKQAALLEELNVRSRHLNMFNDEAWLPPLLEFFYQTDDLAARAAFMKGAEALQLLLELQGDPAAKAARWGHVSAALLQRPFRPQGVLAALRLTDVEREAFRARLDSKDLYGTADQRTLRHLLVRCEPPSVALSLSGLSSLIVERVVPQSVPEGSLWRKTRISSLCDPQSAWPDLWFTAAGGAADAAAAAPADAGGAADADTSSTSSSSSSLSPTSSQHHYDVKYWYELQRLNWHGKLGNLMLLPATAAGAAAATADYECKAELWRQAGVAVRLPGFSGPVVDERGRYGRFKFCHDECRQRHADMLQYLISEFEL